MSRKWSYVATNEEGYVTKVAEKDPISTLATVGVYAFKDTSTFVDASLSMLLRNERTNNEFYVAPVYNEYVARGMRVGIYTITADSMHGLGTPEDLQCYVDRVVN
jgi:dTDP-glucose pyrophosphorylase